MSESKQDINSNDFLPNIVNLVVKNAFHQDAELVKYEKKSYSKEKLGFLGDHFTLYIEVKDKNQSKNDTFFIKIFPEKGHPFQLEYMEQTGVFLQESVFFNKVAPHFYDACPNIKKFLPRCYYAGDKSIVLEDLRLHGFNMHENIFLDKEKLVAAVEAQARLHSASILAESKLGKPLGELYPEACLERVFSEKFAEQLGFYKLFADLLERIAKDNGLPHKNVDGAFSKICRYLTRPIGKHRVLCHGDSWRNNIMFDESDPPNAVLIDFQFSRYAERTCDLAHLLYLCTSQEIRQKYEKDALRAYHDEFSKTIKSYEPDFDTPTYEKFLEEYEEHRFFGQAIAVADFPLILLDQSYINGSEGCSDYIIKFCLRENNDCVFEEMEKNAFYKKSITDAAIELIKQCENFTLPDY